MLSEKDQIETKCLDKGFVRLVDTMGSDADICEAARVSYKGEQLTSKDEQLIRHLFRKTHVSPSEMGEMKFIIKCPIFVVRQLVRHRTSDIVGDNYGGKVYCSMNEKSGRYTTTELNEYYIPDLEHINKQSKVNNQGRGELFDTDQAEDFRQIIDYVSEDAFYHYHELCYHGVAKELSRIVLPLNTYTEFYFKMDLNNLFHFLKLRMDSHAQYEIRVYAEAIFEMVKLHFPIASKAFEDYILNARTLSSLELICMEELMYVKVVSNEWMTGYLNMSKSEVNDFRQFAIEKLNVKFDENNIYL
jgi:thymidylate synthase (FAD)